MPDEPAETDAHAVARPLRQRPGRRPARLHGQPAVRPAPVARRHRRLPRPRRRSAARRPARRTSEVDEILAALDRVEHELATDTFEFVQSDEDIHTAVERRVTELAGAAGAKIHTARSRNDQVATDLRLWCKRELLAVARLVVALQDVLLARAEAAGDTYLPGYTHVQRAQPVLLAHHLLAHGWAFARDVDRLVATVERLDVSPLGAGALAGTSLPIDPAATADGARLRRRVRQLPRRGERPRLRRRGAVRPRPRSASTSPASARSGCCGRARSSASPASTTPTPRARR